MQIAVIVPPMCDANTLYASAPRLAAWLRSLGHDVVTLDLGLELLLRMFSRGGLARLFDALDARALRGDLLAMAHNRDRYLAVIDDVVAFLQGRDPTAAYRLARDGSLPEGRWLRGETVETRRARFGSAGRSDLARQRATLLLADLNELVATLSPLYGVVSYGEGLAASSTSFDALHEELGRPPGVIEAMMREVAAELVPPEIELACLTCPFPGTLLGALALGRWMAGARPRARRALGGGYVSTELRQLEDPRVFDFVDYVVLDDGEIPLARICDRLVGRPIGLQRTFTREGGRVVWHEDPDAAEPRFRELPAPDYRGIDMGRYLRPLPPGANPAVRLMSDGPWLKLTAAHGCYWKRCTFCDIHLPYIHAFDPVPAHALADQMDALHAQTGLGGFHFTDEAAPPPLLVNLALELLRRERSYQYWGNIRFDPGFTPDRARLLAAAGMIAVTGGIEIASDALLAKIDKGITVPQVVKVLQAFAGAGIVTHAYLIYGFPGETPQETIDSLEVVRQLMRARLLSSALFHRFTATAHAPVGRRPELFGLRATARSHGGFSNYVVPFERASVAPVDDAVLAILSRAVAAFAREELLDVDVRLLFAPGTMPAPAVAPDLVARTLALPDPTPRDPRLVWLGGPPRWFDGLLQVSTATGKLHSLMAARPMAQSLARCHPHGWSTKGPPRVAELPYTDWVEALRPHGLVVI